MAPPSNKWRNTAIAAFSNLSTAFNLVNIQLAHVIMENQYCGGPSDKCNAAVTAASTAVLVGAIFGQLTFGYIGDCMGRGPALRLTMVLSILGAFVSAFAVPWGDNYTVFDFLVITRLILGVGVGGVYPLSATIAAESSGKEDRGRMVSLVFSMQGIGNVLSPLLGLMFLGIFGTPAFRVKHSMPYPGIAWRMLLGIGALPGLILLPFKARAAAASDDEKQEKMLAPKAASAELTFCQAIRMKQYWPKLAGTAGSWFLFDITYYGNTLFSNTILHDVFHASANKSVIVPTPTDGSSLKNNYCQQLLILACIGLPGYYIATFFMDRWGRRNIQLMGFTLMAVVFLVLGVGLDAFDDIPWLLTLLYGLTFFFSNFGPNSTTFILPSETFPVEVRSTFNGFSAAMGKVGATIGSAAFKPIVDAFQHDDDHLKGPKVAFYGCMAIALLGALLTWAFVEDRRGLEMATASDGQDGQDLPTPVADEAPWDGGEVTGEGGGWRDKVTGAALLCGWLIEVD